MQSALMPDAPTLLEDRWGTGARWLRIIGRLNVGLSVEQAAVSANLIRQRFVAEKAAELGENSPEVARDRKQAVSLLAATTGYAPERARYARPLMILSGITALVLLVACANFTNLMLARSESRRREFVIRLALGGGTWRLIRQSATECILLAVVAGFLGLLLAGWATTVSMKQFAVMIMPVEFGLELDARVLTFASACVAVVIAFGLWPCTRPARSAATASVYQSTGSSRSGAEAGDRRAHDAHHPVGDVHGSPDWRRTAPAYRHQSQISGARVRPQRAPGPDRTGSGRLLRASIRDVDRTCQRTSLGRPRHPSHWRVGPALLDYTNYWVDGTSS